MANRKKITKQDVAQAISKFQKCGGIIAKLPDQKFRATLYVGSEKSGGFESIANYLGRL